MKNKESANKSKTLKQLYGRLTLESPMFVSLFTRVSTKPTIQLCDFTGLKAKYICPKTGLQYHSAEVYERLREMPIDVAQMVGKFRTLGKEVSIFCKK